MLSRLDPRLARLRADVRCVCVAARRAHQRQGHEDDSAWRHGKGLASLLAYARHPHPEEAPGADGLAALLDEARRFLGRPPAEEEGWTE